MEFLTIVGCITLFAGGYVAAIFTWNKIKAYFGLTIGS